MQVSQCSGHNAEAQAETKTTAEKSVAAKRFSAWGRMWVWGREILCVPTQGVHFPAPCLGGVWTALFFRTGRGWEFVGGQKYPIFYEFLGL